MASRRAASSELSPGLVRGGGSGGSDSDWLGDRGVPANSIGDSFQSSGLEVVDGDKACEERHEMSGSDVELEVML